MKNQMELSFPAIAQNESLARTAISAFLLAEDPPLSVISEVRTSVSEAVTNAVVHAYPENEMGRIVMRAKIYDGRVEIEIEDYGCGIESVERAMQPFYTSQPEKERTGMGFSLMQSFMDGVKVCSVLGGGTTVRMIKILHSIHEDAV